MSVSVVVSTYSINQEEYLSECIRSIKLQTYPPHEIILVVDDDKELFDFYRRIMPKYVKIINSGGRGLSRARNAGVKNAEGNIVAFIDDDAYADKRWLEEMINGYSDPLVVGTGGKLIAIWPNNRPKWFPEELDWIVGCTYKGMPENESKIRNPIGCNMSFKKNAIENVGYFKENIGRYGNQLLSGEEAEISIRILNMNPNSHIIYNHKSTVFHKISPKRVNIKYLIKRSFYEGISKGYMRKHYSDIEKKLTTENTYLQFLLSKSIPKLITSPRKDHNISKMISILLSMFFVFIGFVVGFVGWSKQD